MKGWSFSALVAALKSAAFRDVGLSSGNLLEVSTAPNGLGLGFAQIPVITNFDWQTYNFVSGQVLCIDPATAVNQPADLTWGGAEKLSIQVMCAGPGISDRVLFVLPNTLASNSMPYHMNVSGANGSRTFKLSPIIIQNSDLRTTGLNSLNQKRHVGDYVQPSDAEALSSRGYPVASAGVLMVRESKYTVQQMYFAADGSRWQRAATNAAGTTWQTWMEYTHTKSRKLLETGSLELFSNTPFVDFHYGSTTSDYDTRIINDASGTLTVTTPSSVANTLFRIDRGSVVARSVPGTWSIDWDNAQATAYQVQSVTMGAASYIPFIAGKVTKTNEGYPTSVSFGCITSGVNTGQFQSPVIKAYGDNGLYKSWIFNITSGDIECQSNNQTVVMATRDWAKSQFPGKDYVSTVGLEAGDGNRAYFRRSSDNSVIYLASQAWSNQKHPTKDWVSTVGLISNDLNNPYMRRESDNSICYLATRDSVSNLNQVLHANFVQDMRYSGAGRLNIASKGADYLVPGGCAMIGWNTEGQDPVNDTIIYSQLQRYVPAIGWLNIGRV